MLLNPVDPGEQCANLGVVYEGHFFFSVLERERERESNFFSGPEDESLLRVATPCATILFVTIMFRSKHVPNIIKNFYCSVVRRVVRSLNQYFQL